MPKQIQKRWPPIILSLLALLVIFPFRGAITDVVKQNCGQFAGIGQVMCCDEITYRMLIDFARIL